MSLMKVGLAAAAAAAAGAFVLGGTALADTMKSPSPGASGGHGGGGHGGPAHTPVTGDELAKVTAAVRAKDPAVAVDGVHKHADGSYGVFGTKAGSRVGYAVSADLNTVSEKTARAGRHGKPAPATSATK